MSSCSDNDGASAGPGHALETMKQQAWKIIETVNDNFPLWSLLQLAESGGLDIRIIDGKTYQVSRSRPDMLMIVRESRNGDKVTIEAPIGLFSTLHPVLQARGQPIFHLHEH